MTAPGARSRGTTLVIVGDTVHHLGADGRLYTHGALAAQLDQWARRFGRVRFCGVVGDGPPPSSFAPYEAPNVELVTLRAAGGTGIRAKVLALAAVIRWIRVLVPEMRRADAVHLRTPCNVTIPGVLVARALVRNRYAIFAGSWDGYRGEPTTYRLQRWLLRRVFGGVVHAYVAEGGAHGNLRPAFSPVLTAASLTRVAALRTRGSEAGRPGVDRPLRLAAVGRFSTNKNQVALIHAIRMLRTEGLAVEARLIGEGPEWSAVQTMAAGLENVTFVRHASRDEVFATMAWADLDVLPSFREGYPKVLLEGISAGALPVAADRPVNRTMVDGRGWVFDPADPASLAGVLRCAVALETEGWDQRRASCAAYAQDHTVEAFGMEIDHIVRHLWHLP